jgi:hypothetical protein
VQILYISELLPFPGLAEALPGIREQFVAQAGNQATVLDVYFEPVTPFTFDLVVCVLIKTPWFVADYLGQIRYGISPVSKPQLNIGHPVVLVSRSARVESGFWQEQVQQKFDQATQGTEDKVKDEFDAKLTALPQWAPAPLTVEGSPSFNGFSGGERKNSLTPIWGNTLFPAPPEPTSGPPRKRLSDLIWHV